MEREEIILIQKKFSQFHRALFVFVLIYCANQIFWNNVSQNSLYFIVIMVVFLLVEHFILKGNDVKIYEIIVMRYLQVLLISFQLIRTYEAASFGIMVIGLMVFSAELYFAIDFMDSYLRVVYYIIIGVTLSVATLFEMIINESYNRELIVKIIFLGLFTTFVVYVGKFVYQYVEKVYRQILGQARLIDDVNEANNELLDHQRKINKCNELLGIQKLDLEKANNEIKRANSEMEIQSEIVKYISSSLEIDNLMTLITESIINEIGADVCSIVIYPEATDNEFVQYKIRTKLGKGYEMSLGQFVEDRCFEEYLEKNTVYLDNYVQDSVYSFNREATLGSFIIVPLVKKEKRIGALFAGHSKYNYFADDISFFKVIVNQFIIALNNAHLYEKMECMAVTDGLTGLFNRRHLTNLFDDVINETIINHMPVTVALFDIDKFKNINDTYGHVFGDQVIQGIGKLTKETTMDNDGFSGRYGGEEFVIVFPGKGLKDVEKALHLLHYKIKKQDFLYNGEIIHVSVSIGVASFPQTCRNPSELISRADGAMYYAKKHGRDLIIVDQNEVKESML